MTRLLQISDLHFGAEDQAALDWFAAQAAREKPDAIIVTGDLTQRALRREFAVAARWLKALPAPVMVEEGNHDLPYFNLVERFTRPYARVRRVKAHAEERIAFDDCAIVSLKTTARFQLRFNWSHGHVDARAIARAEAALRRATDEQLKIVACHHPLVDLAGTDASGKTRNGAEALRRIAAAGCDVVLSGHVHTPFDVTHDGVRMIGAGTLSERTREHPPSYNELVVAGGELTVTHHERSE